MKRKIKNPVGDELSQEELRQGELIQAEIPASAVRDYITDMLAELCVVAKQGGQEDLHILLKITYQAARTAAER